MARVVELFGKLDIVVNCRYRLQLSRRGYRAGSLEQDRGRESDWHHAGLQTCYTDN